MIDFCQQHSNIPDDLDTAFVLAFDHSSLVVENDEIDDDFEYDDETDPNEPQKKNWIRYMVTTKRLLMNSADSKIVHADATYKIIIQRFPVLNFGTTDNDNTQHFHLLAMMVSKYERTDDFAFAFNALGVGVHRVTGKVFEPTVVMADAAPAIGNGFKMAFGENVTLLMCFTHVMAAVDRKPMVHKESKSLIKTDLRKLRITPNKSSFDTGCSLFLQKLSQREAAFSDYFKTAIGTVELITAYPRQTMQWKAFIQI